MPRAAGVHFERTHKNFGGTTGTLEILGTGRAVRLAAPSDVGGVLSVVCGCAVAVILLGCKGLGKWDVWDL